MGKSPCKGLEVFIGKIPHDMFEYDLVPLLQKVMYTELNVEITKEIFRENSILSTFMLISQNCSERKLSRFSFFGNLAMNFSIESKFQHVFLTIFARVGNTATIWYFVSE